MSGRRFHFHGCFTAFTHRLGGGCLKEIGELLRHTRELKGVSLQQVQADTRINIKYLRALEAGDTTISPGEVYYRGFLRTYGNYLGLDGLSLVEKYKAALTGREPSDRQRQSRSAARTYTVRKPLTRSKRRFAGTLRGYVYLAAFLCFLVLTAYGLTHLLVKDPLGQEVTPATTGVDPETEVVTDDQVPQTPEASDTEPVVPETPQPPQVEITKTEQSSTKILFTVKSQDLKVGLSVAGASEECWIRVSADSKQVFEGTLKSGDQMDWSGNKEITIRVGRPRVARLSINGIDQGLLGDGGEPKNITVQTGQMAE